MGFTYELNKKKYKKTLNILHLKPNLICLSLFTIFYFIINAYAIKFDFLLVFISYLVYALLFIIIVLVINTIYNAICIKKLSKKNIFGTYHLKVNEKEIVETINKIKYVIEIKNIKKIKKHKNYVIIKTSDKVSIIYFRFILNDNYNKLLDFLEKIN